MGAAAIAGRRVPLALPLALLLGLLLLAGWWSKPVRAAAAPTLMRFPNASATEVALVARDALWRAPLSGGTASRLATPGISGITAPRFSPDGRWIAFTGRRAGGFDIFVVPAAGGPVRRLTFEAAAEPSGDLVVAWTPDSRRIVFLSRRASPVFRVLQAFSVAVEGGMAQRLPLNRSGLLCFGPGGHVIAFNRFFRNFELRKRYLGGQAQGIFTYDFGSRKLTRITNWKGTSTAPMWSGRRIYFLSDRGPGFRANLWVCDPEGRGVRQITHFNDTDVDYPSLGARTITFQQGGRLWAIDLPSERLRRIAVVVPDDGAQTMPRSMAVGPWARAENATGGIDYALSPDGGSLLLSARGNLFRVYADRHAVLLTPGPGGVDEDHPSWSRDGRFIAFETDRGGEQQLAIRPAAGGPARVLTHFRTGYRYDATWSPSGDMLAVPDANHALWLVPTDGSGARLVARDPAAEIRDPCFSPDARWLAYSATGANQQRAIHLREMSSGRDTVVSTPMNSDRSPAFSSDGRLLLFVSRRNELPFVSDRDDESIIATINSDGLYAATLDPADPSPLLRPAAAPAGGASTRAIHVDLAGLMSRAVALPVTPAVIDSLAVRGARLFFETSPPQLVSGDLPGGRSALHVLDLDDLHDRIVATGLSGASLSGDGSRVGFRSEGAWHIAATAASAAAPGRPGGGADLTIDLSGLRATVDPRLEWREMFEQAWRLDRDLFFSAAMNGDNWQAVHDAYAPLLPLLGSNDDMLYLLAQLQGELASSHTFLLPGPVPGPVPGGPDPRSGAGSPRLGADYALDRRSGRYRFAPIYRGDNTRPELRAPLSQPGLELRDGDTLLAINRRPLRAPDDPDSLLAGHRGPLTLQVCRCPDGAPRTVTVEPVNNEMPLRLEEMIARNRQRVAQLSGGRLGYVFLSDFHDLGPREFVRQFYPQSGKAGLVIDVRWNRGGFTSQAVLDVLRRVRAGVFVNREGAVSSLPATVPPPVLVALINEGSASDGDQFPFFFRRFGLGPVVGTRSWGGVQGINSPWQLLDGAAITIPKDSLADLDRRWVIENVGTVPDVTVEDRPDEVVTGIDAQLDGATRVALARLGGTAIVPLRAPPPLPAYPAAGDVPAASFGTKPGGLTRRPLRRSVVAGSPSRPPPPDQPTGGG